MTDKAITGDKNQVTEESGALWPACLTIVWGCYQGGVETALYYRLKELNRLGVPAHIFFYYSGGRIKTFEGIPHRVSNNQRDLIEYIQENSFTVVTFINTLYNFDALLNSGFQGTCIFECHGFSPGVLKELRRINWGEDRGRIRAVVVPGQHVAAIVSAALWKRPDIEVFVARNTLDTELFQNKPTTAFREWMGFPKRWGHCPIIGWVGRVDANKNWRLLLRIFRKIKEQHPKVKLLIACDGQNSPGIPSFKRKAKSYNVEQDVLIVPNIPHERMPEFYSLIAETGGVLLSTSYSEGYPYHLLEAQACRCPIVCTLAGGSPEVVAHGSTGFVFFGYDTHDAVSLVQELLTYPKLRETIVNEQREKVCFQNSVESRVSEYLKWLQRIAGDEASLR